MKAHGTGRAATALVTNHCSKHSVALGNGLPSVRMLPMTKGTHGNRDDDYQRAGDDPAGCAPAAGLDASDRIEFVESETGGYAINPAVADVRSLAD